MRAMCSMTRAPKHVSVLRALPATAVGKIFKPTLHKLEVEAVVRSEATRVGATIAQLRVEDDPDQGAIVRIRAVGNAASLKLHSSALGSNGNWCLETDEVGRPGFDGELLSPWR